MVERIDASVNEIAGGESMMMCAYRSPKSCNSFRISSEPSNSAGFGGTGPEVRILEIGRARTRLNDAVRDLSRLQATSSIREHSRFQTAHEVSAGAGRNR